MGPRQKAAILIISDAAAKDPTLDRTGALAPVLARECKWDTSQFASFRTTFSRFNKQFATGRMAPFGTIWSCLVPW
ncbi:hypothetical protein N7467_006436 [Penicillium canescens]|nr:hypothetical protein N7467_006436 [Penicillium canescens]